MLYDVTVYLGGDVYAIEQVLGYDAAAEIQSFYAQWPEYEVDIEPNVYGYIKAHTPFKVAN